MRYVRMPIEIESPEQMGYSNLKYNLTESSFSDMKLGALGAEAQDLSQLVLCYGDHLGHPELRTLIASVSGPDFTKEDVILTAGASTALFIVATSLLDRGDRILVERPNYGTNLETPRAMRAEVDLLELTFESGYRPTLPQIESQLRTDTKLLSITLPHNPTGTTLTLHELQAIVKLTRERGMWLLVDETYREMAFPGHELPVAASLGDHVISVSSLSKTYGLPGLRMGWILTQNPKLQELFLAGKEQIVICGSVLDEEVSYRFLRRRQTLLPQVLKSMTEKREILWKWFHSQDFLEWVEPRGGVVCFPRIRASAGIEVERFYQLLNQKYSTFVGPGHWFELPKTSMRIGYGWPTHEELHEGLKNISRALEEART